MAKHLPSVTWLLRAVQHTIMAQAAARAYPGQFRLLGGAIMPPGQP